MGVIVHRHEEAVPCSPATPPPCVPTPPPTEGIGGSSEYPYPAGHGVPLPGKQSLAGSPYPAALIASTTGGGLLTSTPLISTAHQSRVILHPPQQEQSVGGHVILHPPAPSSADRQGDSGH